MDLKFPFEVTFINLSDQDKTASYWFLVRYHNGTELDVLEQTKCWGVFDRVDQQIKKKYGVDEDNRDVGVEYGAYWPAPIWGYLFPVHGIPWSEFRPEWLIEILSDLNNVHPVMGVVIGESKDAVLGYLADLSLNESGD